MEGPLSDEERACPRVSFRQFAVIAALSEAVVALDTHTRQALASMHLDTLKDKLHRAKQLFYCFDSKKTVSVRGGGGERKKKMELP